MYESYFKLLRRPFPPVAVDELYFPGEAIEQARVTLARCIRRAEGSGVAIGPTGTGKTMLCRILAREFADQLPAVHLASGRLSCRRSLLQAILYSLGQPYRGLDEGEARLAMVDYLATSDECPEGIVLLVDEAHALPLRLLDEVRMTTNLARDGRPLVRLVLAGSCALEERLATPKLDSFNQRIVARCYLESFSRDESVQYIQAQLDAVGGAAETLFPEKACRAVHRATDGVPRLINQLCDHALLMACAAGAPYVTAEVVEEAWADLQQLPTPWSVECPASPAASSDQSVIEFGGLDDDPAPAELPSSVAEDEPVGDEGTEDEFPTEATFEFDGADDDEDETDDPPSLRISAFDDDDEPTAAASAGDSIDLTGRVDQIARLLEESARAVDADEAAEPTAEETADETADDGEEFRPAGTIRPEVELRFEPADDPFEEQFDEEEVVEDSIQQEATASPDGSDSTDEVVCEDDSRAGATGVSPVPAECPHPGPLPRER